MKIVFSFDDGLLDFYENVFPILKKYNLKATLNVITGYADGSIKSEFKFCSLAQIKEMSNYGIEIANHTNAHKKQTSTNDIDICQKKLKNLLNSETYGLVLPYNQKISKSILKWCKLNNIKYIRSKLITKNIKNIFLIFLHKIHVISDFDYKVKLARKTYKKNSITIIPSIEILSRYTPDYYEKIIEKSRKAGFLTFMFHSVVSGNVNTPYIEGNWEPEQLEELIKYCMQKNIVITSQMDAIKNL